MIVLVLTALFGAAFSAELDPSLTEWRLVTQNEERIKFPLRDYILEVKAFLPDEYDTNPPYSELFRTDKSTTMMITLHASTGGWKKNVGRLVWNTIKYDRGYDIAIEECDAKYQSYRSFPAGGKKEQIWAWNFFEDHVELTCDGELQYEQNFDEGDVHARKPGLPQSCRALGDADVDKITLKHMAGEYIRGRPKTVKETTLPQIETTAPPTTEPSTTESPELPDDSKFAEPYPTCDCWTPECNFCANMECTVQHDLIGDDDLGIQVTSKLGWKIINSIVLYDEDGNTLGMFQWNLKKILLTGCVNCHSPPAIRSIKPGTVDMWVFSLDMIDGVLTLKLSIGGNVVYENELVGECADRYKNVDRFAFLDMTCESTFKYAKEQMVAGARVTPDCAGSCPSS